MKEVFSDIWTLADRLRLEGKSICVCITTNGVVRSDGACVMGRGIALQATLKAPGIAYRIGEAIKKQGNHLYMMGDYCTFPVKHKWWELADLELIKDSAGELLSLALLYPEITFLLPRPGC